MRPLGYWIKEIDRRVEAEFGRVLAAEGVTRRHWQVLTTLAQRPAVAGTELDAALAPFAPTVRPQVDDLVDRGWAAETAGTVTLTPAGRAAHDRLAEQVEAFRARVTEGLSAQDYRTLITLLERVAGNLTPA
ncbi:MarR family winged helix-turn-helix transcriptional regulator [Amorphoplanes nipponensis]|uniref:HTH marR-type domain-containing protein n=1 Tax=Actinoplanes nipponensis TaxID=135950 RepID=A0A919MT63_9ACTN|nr:hypothetical protein [Actinoplanes nipponensis]GIE53283.1 hypothetical protein Ani05nite_68170 [Actinoplanes nipponensis]